MATQIGRFELLSEIARSDRATVYKANDSTNGQTVALKAMRLEMPAEQAQALIERVQAEADTVSALNSPNIAQLYGAGEIDNVLCAAMEYVQGNSIATMLVRKEGFSIWDLLDISRQVCLGLDHAHSHGVVHYSFEPAKVMVQWDGTVKILSFGISTMGSPQREASGKPGLTLHYASPEQLRGEPIDPRSNFFSWAAVLYEMVTDQKAFDGEDSETLRRKILEQNPVVPAEMNRKIHPAVSDLIMKALSKAPDERFQNGQQLIAELEKCKQASTPAAAKKAGVPPQGLIVPTKVTPTAGKSTGTADKEAPPAPAANSKTSAKSPAKKAAPAPVNSEPPSDEDSPLLDVDGESATQDPKPVTVTPRPTSKAAAAAASGSTSSVSAPTNSPQVHQTTPRTSSRTSTPNVDKKQVKVSAAAEPTASPAKYTVDPMMAEDGPGSRQASSFSELEEMPPLKEIYITPPQPPAEDPAAEETVPAAVFLGKAEPPKPKVPPRVVAKHAIKEIRSVPPQLMMYSVAGAIALVLVIAVGLAFHIHSQSAEDEGTPPPASAPVQAEASPTQPAAVPTTEVPLSPQAATPQAEEPTSVEVAPVVKPRYKHKPSTPAPAHLASVPGQLSIDSTPQGAQVQIDGRTDAAWLTPFAVAGVAAGRHTITISKSGYTSEARTVEVASASKSFVVLHLGQAPATIAVHSDPPGAAIFVDGKDSGHVTPAQLSVERGNHSLLVRKQGYLDETASTNLQPGQTFRFAPALRALGNVDDIRTVGKFKKIFGAGEGASEMGTVSVKTQPKGAQIAVNRRMLDKASPVQFMIGPGNYMIDITAPGYKSIHRVVNVEKGNKVVLEETLQRE